MRHFFGSLMGRFTALYRRSGIERVLSLSFTAVTVLGMLFLGMALFLRFSAASNAQMAETSQRVLAQVNYNLDAYLRSMMRVSDTAYYSVIKNTDLSVDDFEDEMRLLYENNKDSLVSIAVFSENGGLISAVPLSSLMPSAVPARQEWFLSAMGQIENLHFSTPHVQNLFKDPDHRYRWVVSLSRQVVLTRGGVTESGVLLVDMSFGGIEQLCKDTSLSDSGAYLYLIDGDSEIIYHPRQQLIYSGLSEENNLVAAGYEDGSYEEEFLGENRQVTVKTVGYTGWKLVGVVPIGGIFGSYGQLLLFFLFIILFSIFLLSFLNFHISQRIGAPIKALNRAVKALEAGRENVDFDINGPYEIEHLSHSISSLVSTMRHLMDDIIHQEAQKRRSELDVLHSQINPHFLYNTLDSVVWMTENGRTEEAITMVTSLARLFRISLSRGSNLIPLKDELEHAHHYMTIQGMRYKNKFSTEIRSSSDTQGLFTIKLLIQPLLENAIYYGMVNADGEGKILVDVSCLGDDLFIDVSDNGCGMPEEAVARLLEEGPTATASKGSGIGLKNVHRRIRLTFGRPYGLSVLSEPDAGTIVRLRLPALNEHEAAVFGKEVGL